MEVLTLVKIFENLEEVDEEEEEEEEDEEEEEKEDEEEEEKEEEEEEEREREGGIDTKDFSHSPNPTKFAEKPDVELH